ncbi:hypothetical protein GCM10010123_41410 [Pilimelia anulata]|uniref:DUF6879 domain-containing protein n=1 Tax=Pilimelia anulata TaxID=53371 RepID=A0A8J3FC38_9ACTN|nr:DUF6879 family protein [Pilimelia anulata]GGK07282.1 hypothetical protein GCM10010123_41410 [Pilimelia anulata]
MNRELTPQEFVAAIENFERSRWRMEFQRYYASDTESDEFSTWAAGGPIDWAADDEWIARIRSMTDEGKDIRRIKVVDEPLTSTGVGSISNSTGSTLPATGPGGVPARI